MSITPEMMYNLGRIKSIKGEAIFSEDEKYRYLLTRKWGDGVRVCNFIMCNPSTATAELLDPTVRKCLEWSILWEYDELIVTNIFAYRSTDVKQIYKVEDPIGPQNNSCIERMFQWCKVFDGRVIAAWSKHGAYKNRGEEVKKIAERVGIDLYYLHLNEDGSPSHPLYLPKSTIPTLWRDNERTVDEQC